MKKIFANFISVFVCLVMASCVFTSCSKDGNDVGGGNEIVNPDDPNNPSGLIFKYEYYTPCMDWGCTADDITAYMSKMTGWRFIDSMTNSLIVYRRESASASINYHMSSGRLSGVKYTFECETNRTSDLIADFEKEFNCQLKKSDSGTTAEVWENNLVNINNKPCSIYVFSTSYVQYHFITVTIATR